MTQNFLTYKTLPDRQTAEDFAKILEEKGINVIIEEDSKSFDASFSYNPIEKDYRLKIISENFLKADLAYKEYYQSIIKDLPKDYYLYYYESKNKYKDKIIIIIGLTLVIIKVFFIVISYTRF